MIVEQPHTSVFDWLDHPAVHGPATVSIVSIALWTLIQWGWRRERYKKKGLSFWSEYKDEFWVSVGAVVVFIIYDSQIVYALEIAYEWASGNEVEVPTELGPRHYFLVGPIVELLYSWGKILHNKVRGNDDTDTGSDEGDS